MTAETYNVHRWADAIVRVNGRAQAYATMREAQTRAADLATIGIVAIIEDLTALPRNTVREVSYPQPRHA